MLIYERKEKNKLYGQEEKWYCSISQKYLTIGTYFQEVMQNQQMKVNWKQTVIKMKFIIVPW